MERKNFKSISDESFQYKDLDCFDFDPNGFKCNRIPLSTLKCPFFMQPTKSMQILQPHSQPYLDKTINHISHVIPLEKFNIVC